MALRLGASFVIGKSLAQRDRAPPAGRTRPVAYRGDPVTQAAAAGV